VDAISEEKIIYFREKILSWYKANGRRFSWRKRGLKPYQYIIAEVLLQRTKAATAAPFYERFIIDFPGCESISRVPVEELALYLKPVGLYNQRA
jgi:A/G-specific adenine glycosylase